MPVPRPEEELNCFAAIPLQTVTAVADEVGDRNSLFAIEPNQGDIRAALYPPLRQFRSRRINAFRGPVRSHVEALIATLTT